MPTISISKSYFHKLLGQKLTDKEFEDHCFDFGLEVEEDKENSETNIKVELPANRYDLLSVEGLANAFSNYLELKKPLKYTVSPAQNKLFVEESVKKIRPFCVSGIIRNVTFCQESYDSFIDFQDKLHHNLGRKRELVSIGTHDLDKTKGPYFYRAKKPEEFSFKSLNQEKEMTGKEMLEFYKKDLNLKSYVELVENSDVIPLIMDSNDNILSMPPIINSDLSKITLNTKNIFIDITATDKTKALFALNVICSSYSIYSDTPCTFEQMEIVDGEESFKCPSNPLEKTMKVSTKYLEKICGIELTEEIVCKNLLKMGLESKLCENKESYCVTIPFFRNDILNQCDLAEDLAIGIGFNNLPYAEPTTICTGKQNKLNQLTELMRQELAFCGFSECLNFSLCSYDDITKNLKKESDNRAIEIANPKTLDFQVGRTSLLPGLLKSLANNKKNKVPFKLFELGDIMLLQKREENKNVDEFIGARNQRNLAVVYTNSNTSGFDIVHGILDMIMTKLFKYKKKYVLKENNSPYFLHDLQGSIFIDGVNVGELGILHPDVLKIQGIIYPSSYLELNFEELCKLL